MARIPEAELTRLKQEVSLQRLVESKGIELKKHGAADLIGRCPFHDDTTPSLVVSPRSNLWHCLGACQTGGSVIDWVMKAEGVSFRHAVELLKSDSPLLSAPVSKPRVGRPPRDGRTVAKQSTVPKLEPVLSRSAEDNELLRQVVEYYHARLKQSVEALAYLEKRGLKSAEMIDQFKLGLCDRTLGYRLPAKNREAGADIRARLQKLGILRKSGHEHFRGSLVIPVLDASGCVQGMYGRKLNDHLRPGTVYHLYLPGPHRGVWNSEALTASEEVILCESFIDALTFWCAGFRNVTAAYGVEGFTAEHLEAFKQHGTKRVLIAYDRDDAGERAAEKLASRLMAEGLECYRVKFPRGMDANEYALSVQPAEKSLGVALRGAAWMGKGVAPAGGVTAAKSTTPTAPSESATPAAESPPRAPVAPGGARDLGGPEPVQGPLAAEAAAGESFAATGASAMPSTLEPEAKPPAPPAPMTAPPSPGPHAEPAVVQPDASAPSSPGVAGIKAELRGDEVALRFGDRRWRVRGLAKNTSYDALRVNVLCGRGEAFHVDTLDLYSARHRAIYAKAAAEELSIEEDTAKKDLGKVLLKLEELQDRQIQDALKPKDEPPPMSEADKAAALKLLGSPDLLERILADFDRCGVVGEQTNKLMGYLAAVSRKLEAPLAVIIQSSSAAGKSSLMESILAFMPAEERVKFSAMTGQSLFYMGETDLKYKILAIVEEEGAQRAAYALKLLQSEGELTIASTGKDPTTGRHITHEYRVEGPVMIFLTTTAIEIDEELLNRCLVLTVDEEREQTRLIHRKQRESQTLEGLLAREERTRILKLHQNAQRLLRPVLVVNPYAEQLTFLDAKTRTRRDHLKYLTLIRGIAMLHQYQRPMRRTAGGREYIEVTLDDIRVANRLAHEVLGRSLDELPPQTRRLLLQLDAMVSAGSKRLEMDRQDYRFSRREVREHTGMSYEQVRVHLERLVELEYVLVHRGGRGQSFVYELLYDGGGKNGTPFVMNLLDVESLAAGRSTSTTETLGGGKAQFGGPYRGQTGPIPGSYRGGENRAEPHRSAVRGDPRSPETGKALIRDKDDPAESSYVPVTAAAAAAAAGGR